MMKNDLYPKGYGREDHIKPDFSKCCTSVYGDIWSGYKQCKRARGYGPDQAYCKQHSPDAVAARRAKQDEKYQNEMKSWMMRNRAERWYDVLKQIADGHNDPRTLAAEAIKDIES